MTLNKCRLRRRSLCLGLGSHCWDKVTWGGGTKGRQVVPEMCLGNSGHLPSGTAPLIWTTVLQA